MACNRDPKHYGLYSNDPNAFDLRNFLTPEGKFDKTKKEIGSSFMTFGLGKRSCPGRFLAFRLLCITIALVIARYKVQLDCSQLKGKNKGRNAKDVEIKLKFSGSLIAPDPDLPIKFSHRKY